LPFFRPIFDQGGKFRIWAGHLLPDLTVHKVLDEMMMAPLFPVPLEVLKAELDFTDFRAGETLEPGPGVTVRTAPLNHPNGATGYRVDYRSKSICYVTDTEHVVGAPDHNILGLIEGSDIMIYDCMYTDEEFAGHQGWGHSSWEEGLRLCEAAGVKKFVIFHHDPDHDDAFLDAIAEQAAGLRPGTVVAQEGLVLRP
ncbi:MAG: MBL fold metallo-hydrolase, partial [Alphaproteobacteria bacterium]